jgi:hypothetical protein
MRLCGTLWLFQVRAYFLGEETMAKPAKLVAMSQFDIENKILDYFCDRFHRPRGEINRNTDLKVHFNFSDATWASVADGLSDEDWMKALNVEIEQSEMKGNNTAKALASTIWAKTSKLVAVHASPAMLNTFSIPLRSPGGRASTAKAGRAKNAKKKKPAKKRG